jgi:predicted RNase H-like nuclease (RuvC/YqgF family)
MGINALKKKITDFLDAAAGNAVSSKLRAELEKRDSDITVLKQLLDEQGKKIDELSRRK